MMKAKRDGVGGYAEVHIMVRFFVFLILGGGKGLENGVEEWNNSRIIFSLSAQKEKDYRKKYSAKEKEGTGNKRGKWAGMKEAIVCVL